MVSSYFLYASWLVWLQDALLEFNRHPDQRAVQGKTAFLKSWRSDTRRVVNRQLASER
jgi:hypothetical protein